MLHSLSTNFFLRLGLLLYLITSTGCNYLQERQTNQLYENLMPLDTVIGLLSSYSDKEIQLIHYDLKNIKDVCFRNKTPSAEPQYIATAGGPGACKTTILEIYLHNKPNCVYVDPDQRALRYMINTYYQSLSNYENITYSSYRDLQKNAYTKWRSASHYIAYTILNEAYAKGYNIAHGTTSTAEIIEALYKRLKQKNYKIIFLLCYAPDETRNKASEYQTTVQGFYQVSPEDALNKGKLFPQRFPLYFKYADKIYLYWTQDYSKGSIHAATYEKGKKLVVTNDEALRNFIQKYDDDRKNTQLPSFDELLKNK